MRYVDESLHTTLQQRFAISKDKQHYIKLFLIASVAVLFCDELLNVQLLYLYRNFISFSLLGGLLLLGSWHIKSTAALKLENEQLKQLTEQQSAKLESAQKQFADFEHIMAHDLKEPLRVISGFACLVDKKLEKLGLTDKETTDYIAHIQAGIRNLETLIKNARAYLTIDFRKSEYTEVSMQQLIAKVAANTCNADAIEPAEVKIHNLKNVYGNPEMLEELFTQLFSNAVKYHHADQSPEIVVGCTEKRNHIQYYVKDNGIGINKKYFCVIFQAFKCLHSKIKYEGTGVGLAMCKKIVDIHGGDIWVESNEGSGSTFYMTLPKKAIEGKT